MQPDRREFLKTTAATTAAFGLGLAATTKLAAAAETATASNQGRIFKSLKYNMVNIKGSIEDKFQLVKELGYDGIEMDSPTKVNLDEALAASRKLELPIHGVVDSVHWYRRLSSPKADVRAQGVAGLETALRDSHRLGGSSALLVPGKVTGESETHDDVWKRSITEIRKTLPLASQLGIRILIENVWNGFCETPEQLRDYIDEIDSPWVGVYFDIGNVRKFSPSEDWVRTLGSRIVKLDVKGWGKAEGFDHKIGDGDVNWPEVVKALDEIQFTGWCTAEVRGGGRELLADIAQRMDRVLQLA